MRSIQSCDVETRGNGNQVGFRELAPLLVCPTCGRHDEPLFATARHLQCLHCNTRFPVYQKGGVRIPSLFHDPNSTRLEWKARLNGFIQVNKREQRRLEAAITSKRASDLSLWRMRHLLQARKAERGELSALITPLGLERLDFDCNSDPTRLLRSKFPKNQGLTSYYNNIFRDWAWNNGENEQQLDAVRSVLPTGNTNAEVGSQLGKILTLGAGACRLPYDLHRTYSPVLSVVLDINPLLIFLASRLIFGETISLHEFPIAPLDVKSFAVRQKCKAPESINQASQRFQFLLADGMNPPFAQASFDTVLTPWLIDIMPQNLSEFMPRVNRLLKPGGLWINTGSLAFFHEDETWRYSEEEVVELCEANGFQILKAERRRLPYLQSPVSAHGRTEKVFSFCARKISDVLPLPTYEYLPEWILDTGQPVPGGLAISLASSSHLLQAQVFAVIDGTRTIDDIGAIIANHYGLRVEEATLAVRRVLVDQYEGSESI